LKLSHPLNYRRRDSASLLNYAIEKHDSLSSAKRKKYTNLSAA